MTHIASILFKTLSELLCPAASAFVHLTPIMCLHMEILNSSRTAPFKSVFTTYTVGCLSLSVQTVIESSCGEC